MPKPERKHDFTVKEIQAGALVLLSAVVLLGFLAVINGYRPPEEMRVYHAKFSNTIGLKKGAEVRFGGMLAGRVDTIAPDTKDQTQIVVSAKVQPSIPVNAESIATIETLSLTAEKHLEISTGTGDAARVADGAELKSVTKSGGFIDIPNVDGLVSGSEDLISDLRDLLGVKKALEQEAASGEEMARLTAITQDVRDLLGVDEAKAAEAAGQGEAANVTRIMADLRRFLGVQEALKAEAEGKGELVELTQITDDVGSIFKKYEPQLQDIVGKVPEMQDAVQKLLDQLNGLLEKNGDSLGNTIKGVEDLVTKLRDNSQDLIDALKRTLSNADKLTGTAADFLDANRPTLEDMLGDLNKTVTNLNGLLGTLKNNPQAVLWGKPLEGRKP